MEATGDYWKPVYFVLESQGLDCELYHAAQVKALPGRPKTDRADSVWLAKITERGSLPSSFVPPEPIRRLRTRTRYRRHLTQARTAEKQRVEDRPAGRGPGLLVPDRTARRGPVNDARHHRLLHRADR
jgi:transposase